MPQNYHRDTTDRHLRIEKSRRGFLRRLAGGIPFLCVLLALVIVSATAASADDSESQQPPPRPTPAQMQAALNAENSAVYNAQPTDPKAAQELPHQDLSREQALELIAAVFEPELQAPAGIFDELEVERFVSDNAAVIAPGDQPEPSGPVIGGDPSESYEGATLLESTIPLRAEDSSGDESVVDLNLEHNEGELQPENPLVEVGIPQQLGEGVEIPSSGVKIELAGAPADRAPSTVEDSVAVYPEVATDSSLAVAPTPSGLETMTLLQSADAPTSQTFHLSLPANASLTPTTAGGAEILEGNKPVLDVLPPTAVDANGKEVPVDLEVSGDSLSLHVSPDGETAYPILVDPVYEDYNWLNNITGTTGWSKFSTTSNYYADDHATCTSYASPYACQAGLPSNQKGMYLGLLPGSVPAGSAVGWEYHVPRWSDDWSKTGTAPTSFISSMTFEAFAMWSRTDTNSDPIMWTGIWNTQTPGWVSGYAKGGDTAPWKYPGNYQIYNAGQNTEGKVGAFTIGNASGHNLSAFRDAFLGRAIINLGDNAAPKLSPILATNWLGASSGSFPLAYGEISDTGLGVARIEATDPSGNVYKTPTGTTCAGTAPNPCPRTKTPSSEPGNKLEYDISELPQGINQMAVRAQDPLGNTSAATTAEVLIDRTAPSVALSGTMTEQANAGTNAAQYTLKYSATDGDAAAASAQTPFGGAGTGESKTEQPKGVAVDSSGNLWVIDRGNERVEEFSASGQLLRQFGSAGTGNGHFSDPRGIAVSSNGTVWVSDMGNNNVQAFNSSGQFLRKIAYSAFVDPYAIAPAPGGVIWVSDITSDQLYEFSESGSFIRAVNQAENSNPKSATGLVADPAGNLWLLDYMQNVVQKYSPTGQFLMQFGSTGSGNGQLQSPIGIALTPSGNVLVSDAGNNRIEEFQPNGVYLRKFGSLGSGTGQMSEARGIAFGPGNVLYLADEGNHRIDSWSHADLDRQSGVVSTEVKVDGQLVEPKYAPGCSTENCSINNREWTLKANAYSSGQHNVKVIATDGVGLSTTKELTITTDTTPPQLETESSFYTAPEGWLEQKSYTATAVAGDEGGSGVSSLILKIDGKVVSSHSQSCPYRECYAYIFPTIDMATYKGGAHPAELIATDVAGNTAKKAWTINVDPKGAIGPSEAASTLKAVESTSDVTIVSPDGLPEEPETVPVLHQEGEDLYTSGAPAETTMTVDPVDGFTVQTPEEPVEVVPVSMAAGATNVELASSSAAVTGNVSSNIDAITRPVYDGDMVFQSIRDATSPETFSWEVELGSRLSMSQIDSENIGVYHPDGSEAMLIRAELAHDAVGKEVSTTLTLESPNVMTLTVHHRVAGVTYPVVSGASFEVGYEHVETYDPPPPSEEGEEGGEGGEGAFWAKQLPNGWWITAEAGATTVGAPEVDPTSSAGAMASGVWVPRKVVISRPFKSPACWHLHTSVTPPIHPNEHAEPCNITESLMARGWVHGHFHYELEPYKSVWWHGGREEEIDCDVDHLHNAEWAMWPKECQFSGENQQKGVGAHIVARHFWRVETHNGFLNAFGYQVFCLPMYNDLFVTKEGGAVSKSKWWGQDGSAIKAVQFTEACPWPV